MTRQPGKGDWLAVFGILTFVVLVFGTVALVWVIVGIAIGR